MNRLALHESVAPDLSTHDLVGVAAKAGFDSIGLRVAGVPGAADRWEMGAATPELRRSIDRLLVTRVSVLDIGRAELRGDIDPDELDHSHRGVLDLGVRLGAHWATACPVGPDVTDAQVEQLFSRFVRESAAYQIVPLLVPQPNTTIDSTAAALDLVGRTGGGIVADISIEASAADIEAMLVGAGNAVGYIRLHADQLDAAAADPAHSAGLLATVPAHLPLAVGALGPRSSESELALVDRARAWRNLIDQMLEHPRARAARLGR